MLHVLAIPSKSTTVVLINIVYVYASKYFLTQNSHFIVYIKINFSKEVYSKVKKKKRKGKKIKAQREVNIYIDTERAERLKGSIFHFAMNTKVNEVVKSFDMTEEMKNEVIEISKLAIERSTTEKDIATVITDHFKANYGGTWHCIVGRNFASFVTFEKSYYIYLYIGQIAILLFKSG